MKINKRVSIIGVVIFALVITATVTIATTNPFNMYTPPVDNLTAEEKEHVNSVQKMLQESWRIGKESILEIGKQSVGDWEFFDIRNMNETLLPQMSLDERISFVEAIYHNDERKKNLEVGDLRSAILISPDRSEAIVYWEKKDGSYVFMNLRTEVSKTLDQTDKDQKKWYLDGEAVKIESINK